MIRANSHRSWLQRIRGPGREGPHDDIFNVIKCSLSSRSGDEMGQKAQSLRPLGSGEMLGDGRMNPAQGLGKELFSSPCRPVKSWRMSVGLPKAAPSLPTASSVRGHPPVLFHPPFSRRALADTPGTTRLPGRREDAKSLRWGREIKFQQSPQGHHSLPQPTGSHSVPFPCRVPPPPPLFVGSPTGGGEAQRGCECPQDSSRRSFGG